MAEVLSFVLGTALGTAAAFKYLKLKARSEEKKKYETYQTKNKLYEGVKRK